jgi:hypothetical protein
MAADDRARERATQDAVRRILKERPPEDLPSGSEERLRQRLDDERPARTAARRTRTAAPRTRKAVSSKKRKSAR